jgi:hypothetical protein
MIRPPVFSGMEQPDNSSRLPVNGSDVRPFVPIAEPAGIGQVVHCGAAPVLKADYVINLVGKTGVLFADHAVSQLYSARCATWSRRRRLISRGTRENLAGFRLRHSQDMLQFLEVIDLRLFLKRQFAVLVALDQLGESLLSFKGRSKTCDRFRRGPGGDEFDNLEVGWAGDAHFIFMLSQEGAGSAENSRRCLASEFVERLVNRMPHERRICLQCWFLDFVLIGDGGKRPGWPTRTMCSAFLRHSNSHLFEDLAAPLPTGNCKAVSDTTQGTRERFAHDSFAPISIPSVSSDANSSASLS